MSSDNDFLVRVRDRLHRIAADGHQGYPQYEGYFDTWRLAEIVGVPGRYKGGSVFAEGQYVLADPYPGIVTSVYDPTLNTICAVARGRLRFLQ